MIKVLAGLASSEVSFFGLKMSTFLLCPHMVILGLDVICVLIFSSYKDTSPINLGPIHMTSF